jgi:hypothetical protein
MKIKIDPKHCEKLYAARTLATAQRKAAKREVFSAIKREHGLSNIKLGIRSVVDPFSSKYGVLYDKRSDNDLDNGLTEPTPVAAKPIKPVAKPVAKPIAKSVKTVAAPVVAKSAKPATTPAKPAAKAQPQVMNGISPVKTAKHTIEVRVTIDGVRKRFGYATSEKTKAAYIATLK